MDVTTLPTPLGPFSIAVDDDAVVASSWTEDIDAMLARTIPRYSGGTRRRRDIGVFTDSIRAYFDDGDVAGLDAIPTSQQQGPFLDKALAVLRTVGPGEVVSYAELAALAGSPRAIRAAGSACARNNIPLFVPCHRVISSDGSLGGFAYGLPAKKWLLDHESAAVGKP